MTADFIGKAIVIRTIDTEVKGKILKVDTGNQTITIQPERGTELVIIDSAKIRDLKIITAETYQNGQADQYEVTNAKSPPTSASSSSQYSHASPPQQSQTPGNQGQQKVLANKSIQDSSSITSSDSNCTSSSVAIASTDSKASSSTPFQLPTVANGNAQHGPASKATSRFDQHNIFTSRHHTRDRNKTLNQPPPPTTCSPQQSQRLPPSGRPPRNVFEEEVPNEDFDFEGSLALFNKREWYRVVESADPESDRDAELRERSQFDARREQHQAAKNFKHTEMILSSPKNYAQSPRMSKSAKRIGPSSKPESPLMVNSPRETRNSKVRTAPCSPTLGRNSAENGHMVNDLKKLRLHQPPTGVTSPLTNTTATGTCQTSINTTQLHEILDRCDDQGLTISRQLETFCANACPWIASPVVLSVESRKAQQQRPHIMALIGPGRSGALAMGLVRHLTRRHHVVATVFILPKVQSRATDNKNTLECHAQIDMVKRAQKFPQHAAHSPATFCDRISNLIETVNKTSEQVDFCLDGLNLSSRKYSKKKWYAQLADFLSRQDIAVMSVDPGCAATAPQSSKTDQDTSAAAAVAALSSPSAPAARLIQQRWSIFSVLPIKNLDDDQEEPNSKKEQPNSNNHFAAVFDCGVPLELLSSLAEYPYGQRNFCRVLL